MSLELTVVIPALDEEKGLSVLLPALKKELPKLTESYEVLVVDGGSKDRTVELARCEGAKVIRQESRGFGGAIREGLAASVGKYVITMDGDRSHPVSALKELWKLRDHELVIASRFVPGGSADMPWPRQVLSRLLNVVARRYLGLPVRDSSSGLRLYRGDLARALPLSYPDFSVQQEALTHLLKRGAKVAEVPFHYHARRGGKSKARILPLARSYLRMLAALRSLRPQS